MTIENTGDANFQKPTRSRRIFRFLLAGVFWLMAIEGMTALYHDADKFGLDFYNFWVGGDIIRTNQARTPHQPIELYSQQGFHKFGAEYFSLSTTKSLRQRAIASYWRALETTASPFFYWVFSIASSGDYDRAYTTYIIFSPACLALSIIALGRRLKYSIAGIGLSVALASISAPVYSDLHVANINCPELLLCTIYLLLRDRGHRSGRFSRAAIPLSGCAVGFLIAFKPNLLLPLLLLSFSQLLNNRRAWMFETAGCLLTLSAAVAVSSHAFGGFQCWISWAGVVRELTRIPSKPTDYGNFSLSQTIYEYTGRNFAGALSAILIATAIGVVLLSRRSRKNPPESLMAPGCHSLQSDRRFCSDLTIFGVGTAITFLCSGLAWLHYPVLIFPFLLMLGSSPCAQKTARWVYIARFATLSITVLLLLIPPPVEVLDLLPVHLRIGSSTWVHCTQSAILLVLFTGVGLCIWDANQTYFPIWLSV